MSEYIIPAMAIAAFATWYFYRRSQQPNHLTEIYNSLKAQAELAAARNDAKRAREFRDMADAIREAQRIISSGTLPSSSEADMIRINLLRASGWDVLDALSIFEQNHRHDCYQSVLNLAGKFEKLQKRQAASGAV